MENSWIGFVVFAVAFLAGRYINLRALKVLKEDEKKKLMTEFSKYNKANTVCIVAFLVIYFIVLYLLPDKSDTTEMVFIIVFVGYLLGSTIYAFIRLKQLEIQESYVNQFLLSNLVQYVGVFIFFGIAINAK